MVFNRHISILLLLFLVLNFVSCKKNPLFTESENEKIEVSFNASVSANNKKNILDVSEVDYCYIRIDSMVFRPETYVVDGKIYTQSIKLIPNTYTLNAFIMMNDNNTPNNYSDDVIMLATPLNGSEYSTFVSWPAGLDFNVAHLKKLNIGVEVLLFNPADYDKFGFDFTVLPATTIREQRFIGLIRPKNSADYAGSLYINQSTGLQNEMPAIFSIDVFRNGGYVKTFTNENQLGESFVSVSYPDGNNAVDNYRFDLNVYVRTGTTFGYKYVKSWAFADDEMIPSETDGMVHFVLGECGSTGEPGEIGIYQNLPESCNFTIKPTWAPGSLGSYFDGELSDIATGFSVGNGLYRAWCGTDSVDININHTYQMDVYNSLLPSTLPAYTRGAGRWNAINWLLNNLSNYPTATWGKVQGAVWVILNNWDGVGHLNVPDADEVVNSMVSDAMLHADFIPSCGQKAAVIFVPKGTPRQAINPRLQVVFVMTNL